ncbi:MAG: PQQ-binding-like beta-propeller repeat protein [Pseudomonadota bacterium]
MTMFLRGAAVGALVLALAGCIGSGKPKTPVVGTRTSILATEAGALADPTIAQVPVTLPGALVNEVWAQPGGNASKSMGHLALGAAPARLWSVKIKGSTQRAKLAAAPVVADGRVYLADTDAVVTAYAADTGAVIWSTALHEDKNNRASRFGGGASFADSQVYATSGLGDVVALNAADGKQVWKVKPGGPLRGAPTIANGIVYVLSQDNQLYALSQTSGAVQWTQSGSLESQGVFGVAAPASAQGTVVAGFSSGELNAYRYENGRLLWQDTLSRTSVSTSVSALSDIDADPVIDGGRAYAIGQGGRLVALELATGQRLWEQNFASISTPWLASEWLFVVTDDARLICVARASGKVRWISQLKRYDNVKKRKGPIQWTGPVLAGDRLLLLNSKGQIVSASPADGSVTTTMKGSGKFDLPPVVANSTLYVVSDDGRLSAYR